MSLALLSLLLFKKLSTIQKKYLHLIRKHDSIISPYDLTLWFMTEKVIVHLKLFWFFFSRPNTIWIYFYFNLIIFQQRNIYKSVFFFFFCHLRSTLLKIKIFVSNFHLYMYLLSVAHRLILYKVHWKHVFLFHSHVVPSFKA